MSDPASTVESDERGRKTMQDKAPQQIETMLRSHVEVALKEIWLREDLAVVYERLAPVAMLQSLARRGIEWVTVDDDEYATLGCNILAVRPGVVVMGQRNVRTADKLREQGVEVHTFDSEQSDKGEGGPTCMTRPILRT